jgi:hypothetical protein
VITISAKIFPHSHSFPFIISFTFYFLSTLYIRSRLFALVRYSYNDITRNNGNRRELTDDRRHRASVDCGFEY